jgi:hypothetical protein
MDRDDNLTTTGNGLLATAPLPVPAVDLPAFYKLCTKNQERIKLLATAFAFLSKCPTLRDGYALASQQLRGQRGTSPSRLRTLYSEYRRTKDWRVLIDNALEYTPAAKLPSEFIAHLQVTADANIRSIEQALKKVRRDWTLGLHIPGYGTWQEWHQRTHPGRPLPRTAPPHPHGWTTRNLRRKLDTSKFRRIAATNGRIAATKHRPTVLTTRQGCWVHSHLMWDDVWHDHFVNSFAEKQAGRPLELFSHDFYSARKVRYGIRVRTEGDTGKMQGLTGDMMRMIIAATYHLDGYSPRGTVNIAEHGTAAFSEEVERLLYDTTGGLVTVQRSGLLGDPSHSGQYNGRRIGNPRFKASLESSNNLVHNMLADLPGQTGPSKDRRPEQLHGLLQYNDRLLAALQQLPTERAALLRFPLLEQTQFMLVLSDIYKFLETDHEHNLEGWIECGHTTQELNLLGQWWTQEALLTLPESQQQMAIALLNAGTLQARPRKLSRLEVWQRGSADLVRISGGTVCDILGPSYAAERKVSGHRFGFRDKDLGPGDHYFDAIVEDAEGHHIHLKEGETYLTTANPFAPDQLFVKDAKGRFLGIAPRITRVSRHDVESIHRAIGAAAKKETQLLAPLRQRQMQASREKLALHRHNAGVIEDHQDAIADFTTRATAALDSALDAEPSPQTQTQPTTSHEHDINTLW